jgi:hypothetical protein
MNGELLTQNHYQLQQYADDLQVQNQNQTALALRNDDLQAQEEEDDKYFWDLKEQQKDGLKWHVPCGRRAVSEPSR